MFSTIVSKFKFWRSVLALAIGFALIFLVVKGLLSGGSFFSFFLSWRNVLGLTLGSVIYGFFAAYSRFYKHYKSHNRSK